MKENTYTYRQILIGLRNEFLEFQKELDGLGKYLFIMDHRPDGEYYFNLYKEPYKGMLKEKLPELVLDRDVKQGILQRMGFGYMNPTRALMVKDNNGNYYPLRKYWFKEDSFRVVILPSKEIEFQEKVDEILHSDFAKYMTLNDIVVASVSNMAPINSFNPRIVPGSFQFDLYTNKSKFAYLGRQNTIKFQSIRGPKEKWRPLTQEHLDNVSNIEFLRDDFPAYHQSIIEKSIDDDRPIILATDYESSMYATFEIQDEEKKLVLRKKVSKSK